jgi:deoxyribonuclease V
MTKNIICTDVHYGENDALAAAVLLNDWADVTPLQTWTTPIASIQPYVSGQFYRREMPCLLQLLASVLPTLKEEGGIIVVDSYVWLGTDTNGEPIPGLGAHLYDAFKYLNCEIPVVGVAKTRFAAASPVQEVLRGTSQTPLYVSAVGIDIADASFAVQNMAGEFRIPEALKLVDKLSRTAQIVTV